jgi:phosphoribosylamine--glycine ligase
MAKRGTPFIGLLYAGLILTTSGIKVIEFNVRFGDPETQVVLTRLNSPLSTVLMAAAHGELHKVPSLNWKDESAVTVVMAAAGYPEAPEKGAVITGADEAQGVTVFHAGNYVVNGGRVLSVTALGADLVDARRRAYQGVERISFAGEHHRSDIALMAALGEIKVP